MKDQAIVDNVIGVFADIRSVYAALLFSENYKE